jgi:hypothetical protein
MHHEFYSQVVKMSSSGDPLQGGPKQGSLAGVQNEHFFLVKFKRISFTIHVSTQVSISNASKIHKNMKEIYKKIIKDR